MNLRAGDCKVMDIGINNCNYMNTAMNLKLAVSTQEKYLGVAVDNCIKV